MTIPHSNNQIILGESNSNVPRLLAIVAEVCVQNALEDSPQVYMRLLSIARHIQVREQLCVSGFMQNVIK